MSDIKLAINIPEEIMEYINNNGCLSVIYNDEVAKAIINGMPVQNEDNLSKVYGDGYQAGHKEGYDKGYDDAISIKRLKGKKIVNNDANFDDSVAPFFCSECLKGVHFSDNFCWFCGADLKGDKK